MSKKLCGSHDATKTTSQWNVTKQEYLGDNKDCVEVLQQEKRGKGLNPQTAVA